MPHPMVSWALEPIWEISNSLLLDLMPEHNMDVAFALGILVGFYWHFLAADLDLPAAELHWAAADLH